MIWHNFKYSFTILFKNKMLIFWTFAFPLILGTFFYLAFSNIENSEKLNTIDIAIINNEAFNNNLAFKETFKLLSDSKNPNYLFNTMYTTLEEAKQLLTDSKITGYIYLNPEPQITVHTSDINATILKQVTKSIIETTDVIKSIMSTTQDSSSMTTSLINDIQTLNNATYTKNISHHNLSYTMIEYYTLIAMTCLYGAMLSMTALNSCLANMSNRGKRISISPTSKGKIIISNILASFFTALIGLSLLFSYTIFVLKVDYGSNFLYIVLLSILGTLAGQTLGIATSSLLKTSENTKIGLLIALTMFFCFASGMMGITMKYIIDTNIPLLNKINPANMITDGFYSLYYYPTYNRFFLNVISLILFSCLMICISITSLRREQYDHI